MDTKILFTENKFILENEKGLRALSVAEIFSLFVRKKKLFDIPTANIESISSTVSFVRTFCDLKVILKRNEGGISSICQVKNSDGNYINVEQSKIKSSLELGYLLIDRTWYAISEESINDLSGLLIATNYSSSQLKVGEIFKYLGLNSSSFLDSSNIKLNEIIDEGISDVGRSDGLFKLDLYDYQKIGLRWLQFCGINKIGTILGDDMGLGKTAQVIAYICWCMEVKLYDTFLIVVPSTLLENWRREFLFFTDNQIEPYIHHGSMRTGLHSVLEEKKLIVTTYSLIINDISMFQSIDWGAVILDEASLIKNPKSERTLAIKSLDANMNIAMTGTPVENSLVDLWSISDFCNPGYLGNEEDFRSSYYNQNIESNLQNSNLPVLKDLVSNIMIRRMKEDLLDSLPDKIDVHQALQLGPSELIEYENVREEILAGDAGNTSIMFELIRKLYRFCAHPSLLEGNIDLSIKSLTSRSTKFRRVFELLREIENRNEKVLIFTNIIAMIDLLLHSINSEFKIKVFNIDGRVKTNERQNVIDEFSAEKGFSVMVLNPTTAGMGLNIVAANHVIHYTRQWNPALELQASARAYRNGQKKGVNIYYPYYVDTIEETIDQRLRQKSALSDSVIDITENKDQEINQIYNILKNKTNE